MKAVILAGGLGTRLKPFTDIIPKPLIAINGEETILEIQIKSLASCGFTDIYIATNYKSNLIESYLGDGSNFGINLFYSKESKRLGTCGPVSLLKDKLTEPFLVMNGDILTDLNFKNIFLEAVNDDSLLMVGIKNILTPFDFGNVTIKNNKIVKIEEKPHFCFQILAGIYVMKTGIFDYIPDDTYFGVDELIQVFLKKSIPISSYLIEDYWIDIGRVDSLDEAKEKFSENAKK